MEHRCRPLGQAAETVGPIVGKAVIRTAIGFGLDDTAAADALWRFMDDILAQQAWGQQAGIDTKLVSPPSAAYHSFLR